MSESDSLKKSKFEVAGRMYYEAHAFGYLLNSFTSSGFIDRLGYEKPYLRSTKLMALEEYYNTNKVWIVSLLTTAASLILWKLYSTFFRR